MQQVSAKKWGAFGWGIFASVVLHLAVVAFFLVKLPVPAPQPEEETVSVDLVPPPEEKKPEEKPPELKMPEEPKPEEPKPEEKKAEEKPAEKPAEPPKEAKAEQPPPPPPPPTPPPPPPPPPPAEEAKAPEEKPPEKPPEAQSKEQAGKSQPLSALRPVAEFGDKDTGPEKSTEGDASVAGVKSDTPKPSPEPRPEPQEDQTKPEEMAEAAKAPESKEPPANPVPEDVELPQVDLADNHAEKNGPAAGAESEAKTSFEQGKPPNSTKPDATATAQADKPIELTEAKTLFSQKMTNDPVAKTAMGDMPRGARFNNLCGSELRQQLIHGSPSYLPELIPSYRLSNETVLQVRRSAFKAAGRWYNVSFRCEVDDGAMKVKSFSLAVGDPVPRSEWASRRLD